MTLHFFLIMKNLNADKAHGWDNISTRMIKLRGKETALQIDLFFYLGFLSRPFTNHWIEGEWGGHFFSFSLPLPPASHTVTQ